MVSVIMPAYNAEKFIAEAIESVINQTFEYWELLIIDDGSSDTTAQIIKSFADDRIILLWQDNAGVSSARNRGLELARGKYITFLDADDVLPKESLTVRVGYFKENPKVDVLDGVIFVKDVNMIETLHTYTPYYNGELLPRLLALDSCVFFNVCYMFRKKILGELTFKTKMTHAEDLLFYIQLSSQSNVQYGFVSETVYLYRLGHTSTMSNLAGLEEGYITLLQEIKKDKNISTLSYMIMKLKVMKIMFLSWRAEGRMGCAFLSISNNKRHK